MSPSGREFRIYGDNILECERALNFMAKSLAGPAARVAWIPSPLYTPHYRVLDGKRPLFEAQLFPGYGRWAYDVQEHFRQLGAPLREATDAVVVRLDPADGQARPVPILALEFCGALPAGNNAWQRCGRALACAYARVPYLYFAELGGVELDAERNVKAARVPNPLVPFAYLSLGQESGSLVVPVFTPSPSITAEVARRFLGCFGETEAQQVVRDLLTEAEDPNPAIGALQQKAARTTQVLAEMRRRHDTLQGAEWVELARHESGTEKVKWLLRKGMEWRKKIGLKQRTTTLPSLLAAAVRAGAVAAGSRDIPICLIGPEGRTRFAEFVAQLYPGKVARPFLDWLGGQKVPLVIVWVAGFKPQGEDSRPDRGLVPLARMLFGTEGVQYLTVVYGPAKVGMWRLFATNMQRLARINGLWEAIVGLSDAILVDSATAGHLPTVGFLVPKTPPEAMKKEGPLLSPTDRPRFGEHDVDTVLHMIFRDAVRLGVFEGMCNPPGGDWSGISVQSSADSEIFKWTSLPRVSGEDSKRPDHIIFFYGPPLAALVLESKEAGASLESGIGPKLARYLQDLVAVVPNVSRAVGAQAWGPYTGSAIPQIHTIISGAAVRYSDVGEMRRILQRGKVEVVLAVEFPADEERVTLHVVALPAAAWVGLKLQELAERFGGRIEVQVH
jgi:hypothetical protein